MKLLIKLALIALLLGPALAPHAAYANNEDTGVSDGGSFDEDEDAVRKKPKFQTRFFD